MKEYQIICIDDDEEFLRSLEGALPDRISPLCDHFVCRFDFVSSPEELMEVLETNAAAGMVPGMIISDQVMPGITGIELLEKVRSRYPDIGCVLLTGHAGLESAKYAINRRLLDQYVSKPIEDLAEFASLAANVLKSHHNEMEERERAAQLKQAMEDLRKTNEKVKAMHAAAEQVAMLSKGLRTLNFDEVVNMITQQVPRIFQAQRGVMCFPEGDCPADGHPRPQLERQNCPCPEEHLLRRADAHESCNYEHVVTGDVPQVCNQLGGQSPHVVVPLTLQMFDEHNHLDARQGYLCLCDVRDGATSSAELLAYKGELLHEVLSANLTNAKLYQQARQESLIDPLTGVGTRRVLEEHMEGEHSRAIRYGRTFCLAIMDVDNFKAVNDRGGHIEGDRALRLLASLMQSQVRSCDILTRYGGDEFVLLMPETSLTEAIGVITRLHDHVETVLGADESLRDMTVSCGVAQWRGTPDDSGIDVLRRADQALYQAKQNGRNHVEVASSTAGV